MTAHLNKIRLVFLSAVLILSTTGLLPRTAQGETSPNFIIISDVRTPSPSQIAEHLEKSWRKFHDLFGVSPGPVRVRISVAAGAAPPSSADPQGGASGERSQAIPEISWMIKEKEPLDSQSFSDLSHEITHIYFINYMEDQGGFHQENAWLHEAVAIYSESDPFRKNREDWIRDRLAERIPLVKLFSMKNPQKENPLVELIAQLNDKLHKGEIKVEEMHRRIAEYTSTHAEDMTRAGIRNMTYYSESFSLFNFLLQTRGKIFIRDLAQALKKGETLEAYLKEKQPDAGGIPKLEEEWVAWVRGK